MIQKVMVVLLNGIQKKELYIIPYLITTMRIMVVQFMLVQIVLQLPKIISQITLLNMISMVVLSNGIQKKV